MINRNPKQHSQQTFFGVTMTTTLALILSGCGGGGGGETTGTTSTTAAVTLPQDIAGTSLRWDYYTPNADNYDVATTYADTSVLGLTYIGETPPTLNYIVRLEDIDVAASDLAGSKVLAKANFMLDDYVDSPENLLANQKMLLYWQDALPLDKEDYAAPAALDAKTKLAIFDFASEAKLQEFVAQVSVNEMEPSDVLLEDKSKSATDTAETAFSTRSKVATDTAGTELYSGDNSDYYIKKADGSYLNITYKDGEVCDFKAGYTPYAVAEQETGDYLLAACQPEPGGGQWLLQQIDANGVLDESKTIETNQMDVNTRDFGQSLDMNDLG